MKSSQDRSWGTGMRWWTVSTLRAREVGDEKEMDTWHNMMWCDVMWCDVGWCDTIWCDAMRGDAMQYDAMRGDAMQYDAMRCDDDKVSKVRSSEVCDQRWDWPYTTCHWHLGVTWEQLLDWSKFWELAQICDSLTATVCFMMRPSKFIYDWIGTLCVCVILLCLDFTAHWWDHILGISVVL